MRIILDNIIFSLQKSGGISIVWQELIKGILRNPIFSIYCVEYTVKGNIFRDKIHVPLNRIFHRSSCLLSIKRYFDVKIKDKEPFIFHSSYYRICSNKKAINVTTVHDFTYEYYYSGIKKKIHCWQKYRAIKYAACVICISNNTKKDLFKFFPNVDHEKVEVVYNGVSDDYMVLKEIDSKCLPFSKGTYVLFVGSREKYKNFDLSVKSVAKMNLNLVIVGAELSKRELNFLTKEFKNSSFKLVGRVSNQELNNLYNGAFSLIYLSEYEGFGIPVIEAQKAGCPVIAYNISSIPEIIGSTPCLLSHLSLEEICNSLELLKQKTIRDSIVQEGINNARRFTWEKMNKRIENIYKEVWWRTNEQNKKS